MSKTKQLSAETAVPLRPFVRCDLCEREWLAGCEQSVAIRKRGKCIVCLVKRGEHFSMDPYEFPSDPGYTPNTTLTGRKPEVLNG